MRSKWLFNTIVVATIMAASFLIVEARRVILRPLTAHQVRTVLKAAGREDALPQGRHISQGIAAITGFSAGVMSGVGGAIVYDLITAPNETLTWINGLFGINSTNTTTQTFSQEICFDSSSRSLHDDDIEGRQTSPTTTNPTSGTTSTTTPTGTLPTTGTIPTSGTSPVTTPGTGTGTNTGTAATTTTGAGGPTCITIVKPKARHRRRRAIVRNI